MRYVLVTGGAGYIGSHTVLELVEAGMSAVIIDNLNNSSEESLRRVAELTGKPEAIVFRKVDLCERGDVEKVFDEFTFDACIHFAGLKAVGESVQMPLAYYRNNLMSTIVLLETMEKYGCRNFVFSSSATVYGLAKTMPVTEKTEINSTNPYGRTKLFIEEFLRDLYKSNTKWNILILRYFNPCGAHESGMVCHKQSYSSRYASTAVKYNCIYLLNLSLLSYDSSIFRRLVRARLASRIISCHTFSR
jgi:UDP-glucose 4-epimerase